MEEVSQQTFAPQAAGVYAGEPGPSQASETPQAYETVSKLLFIIVSIFRHFFGGKKSGGHIGREGQNDGGYLKSFFIIYSGFF